MIAEWLKVLSRLDTFQEQREKLALEDLAPPGPEVVRNCEALCEASVQAGVRPPDKVFPWDEDEIHLRWDIPGGFVDVEVGDDEYALWRRRDEGQHRAVPATSPRLAARTIRRMLDAGPSPACGQEVDEP